MATDKLSYRVFFFTLYSMGLRLGEGLRLQIGDIDETRNGYMFAMPKAIRIGFVPLPDNTLRILRRFWSLHRHPQFLFPSRKRGLKNAHLASMPMDRGGVQVAMTAVVREMGLKKRFPATRSDTATQRTCWKPVLTCSNCSKFSGMSVY